MQAIISALTRHPGPSTTDDCKQLTQDWERYKNTAFPRSRDTRHERNVTNGQCSHCKTAVQQDATISRPLALPSSHTLANAESLCCTRHERGQGTHNKDLARAPLALLDQRLGSLFGISRLVSGLLGPAEDGAELREPVQQAEGLPVLRIQRECWKQTIKS